MVSSIMCNHMNYNRVPNLTFVVFIQNNNHNNHDIEAKEVKLHVNYKFDITFCVYQNPPQNLILIFIIRIYAKKQFHIERGIASQMLMGKTNTR